MNTLNTRSPSDGPLIAPSILSANFGRLAEEIQAVQAAGADWIHIDVMDGHFVPNITMGPVVVKAARAATRLPLDVHLMIEHPDRYLEDFAGAGADLITVHVETCQHLQRTLRQIRNLGKLAGVALNPHTHHSCLQYVLSDVDLVLLMSVNPGFGGQSFLSCVVPKLNAVRVMFDNCEQPPWLQVDGGITPGTAPLVAAVGANVLVAGSAIFGAQDYRQMIESIRQNAHNAGPVAQ